jgi:hypothetical protein
VTKAKGPAERRAAETILKALRKATASRPAKPRPIDPADQGAARRRRNGDPTGESLDARFKAGLKCHLAPANAILYFNITS